jgi:hypothetical protein
MRKLVGLVAGLVVVLLAACELQPAPKKQPAPPPAAAPTETAPKPVEPPPSGAGPGSATGSGSAAAKLEITAPCMEVATKVAQVFVDSATEPGQKSVYEQERANMTRKTGEACTAQAWSEEARACYLATSTPAQIKACEQKFASGAAAPVKPPPTPGT